MRSDHLGAVVVAGASGLALAAAYTGQHIFGLAPCTLCVWQRYPWMVTLALALGALAVPARHRAWPLALAALVLLAGGGLGGFHVGVEQGWWPGLPGCSAPDIHSGMSVNELRETLEARRTVVPCDEPAFTLAGVSMAGYNTLASLALAVFAAVMAMRSHPGRGRAAE